jgi:hypothetical protein
MTPAAEAAMKYAQTLLPNSDYAIPEASPNAKDTGKRVSQDAIKQFGPSPSPRTRGEGRGEGLDSIQTIHARQTPHPDPLPEYGARGPEAQTPRTKVG